MDASAPTIQYVSIFVSALVGTTIGFFSSSLIAYLNARDAAFKASYGTVISRVLTAADLGSEYWLLAVDSDPEATRSENELKAYNSAKLLEAKLLGLSIQIITLDDQLRFNLPLRLRPGLASLRNDLLEALTGGNFQSRTGSAEYESAVKCQRIAANYAAKIHFALRRRMMFDHHFQRISRLLRISSRD